ncbi:MAG: tetratricopeptide repeat protein [Pirellulaceae bacterium]|nr:tetratricopeptide repeat protein [Pirellulaceae bacterium]
MSSFDEIVVLAMQAHQQKRWAEAIDAYRRVLLEYPNYPEVHYNLGSALQSQGASDEALLSYQRAIDLRPDFFEAYNSRGCILKELERFDLAIQEFHQAIRIHPHYAEAYNNLGGAYQLTNRLDEARQAYERALQYRPDLFMAHYNLGVLHFGCGRYADSIAAFQQALQLSPDNVELLFRLGNIYLRDGRCKDAITAFESVLSYDPGMVVAYNSLASAYKDSRDVFRAESTYLRAIELKPDYFEAHLNLANLYLALGRSDDAIRFYRKATELNAESDQAISLLINQLQQTCSWSELESLSKKLIEAVDADRAMHEISPFSFLGLVIPTTNEQQWKCASNWSKFYESKSPPTYLSFRTSPVAQEATNISGMQESVLREKRKIRIGYLSSDFRIHAVAYMIPELLESHDRSEFEVFAYALSRDDGSSIRKRIESAVDRFRVIESYSFKEAADSIASDQIDILVDLNGYTTHSRTEIVALRPAPIQVSYIGYPGTMGASFIDYILADDYVVPLECQGFYSERIVHLPGCYQANDSRHEIASTTPTRRQSGLPDDGFVFCSFNNTYKFSPAIFDVWMRLLKNVTGSVLWLAEPDIATSRNLCQEANRRGVSADRLVFAPRQAIADHLARHRLADLFLDTFPYNAHATASIALRMGVPMVTLSGQAFASRVAGSLLRAVGLSEWIAHDIDDYEAKAMQLATDRQVMLRVRDQLARNLQGCKLFDGQYFARNLEKAFAEIWRLYCQGHAPRHIAVLAGDWR